MSPTVVIVRPPEVSYGNQVIVTKLRLDSDCEIGRAHV